MITLQTRYFLVTDASVMIELKAKTRNDAVLEAKSSKFYQQIRSILALPVEVVYERNKNGALRDFPAFDKAEIDELVSREIFREGYEA